MAENNQQPEMKPVTEDVSGLISAGIRLIEAGNALASIWNDDRKVEWIKAKDQFEAARTKATS